jgi:hypothetical protein
MFSAISQLRTCSLFEKVEIVEDVIMHRKDELTTIKRACQRL